MDTPGHIGDELNFFRLEPEQVGMLNQVQRVFVVTSVADVIPDVVESRGIFEQLKAAIRARKRRPIFALDIAVPRDIEAAVSTLDDVYLYTVDDLNKLVLEGQGNREAAAIDANRILDEEIRRYLSIERSKQVAPLITALRDQGDSIRKDVLEQARRRLAQGADVEEVIEYATAALMKKLLHNPSVRLREAGESSDDGTIRTARSLFGLDKD